MSAAVLDGSVHHATGELFWRKDGTSFPVEYVSTPIRDGECIGGAVVTFKDISERRAAEEERARLYQMLLDREAELREAVGAILLRRADTPVLTAKRKELDGLTARERDVLRLVGQGKTNAQIARILGLQSPTVKDHVRHLLAKLGVENRTQAALWAADLS